MNVAVSFYAHFSSLLWLRIKTNFSKMEIVQRKV